MLAARPCVGERGCRRTTRRVPSHPELIAPGAPSPSRRARTWYLALLSLHALGSCGGFAVVTSLLSFHVMICLKKQTTYEWLVEDIQKKKQRERNGYKSPSERAKLYVAGIFAKARAPRSTSTRTGGTKTVGISAAPPPEGTGLKDVAIEMNHNGGQN